MRLFLEGWRDDVPQAWRPILSGVEPAFDKVRADLVLRDTETIYPGRRGSSLPKTPAGAHIFKSLDRLSPDKVKAVVIGQDPYTNIAQATGRAFEQGDLADWARNGVKVTPSMKALLRVAAHHRTGNNAYLGSGGWARVKADVSAGVVNFKTPRQQFDEWEDAGVLWLNAGLTLSKYVKGGGPEQRFGHLPLWEPVIQRIIQALVRRPNRTVVFLAWGLFAHNVLVHAGVMDDPAWNRSAGEARKPHPSTPQFFPPPNPLTSGNQKLTELGATGINW